MIPEHTKYDIDRYVNDKIPPGGFLEAVFSNNLCQAFGRADRENLNNLFDIVNYIYNHTPMDCWGSPEKVKEWLYPEVKK